VGVVKAVEVMEVMEEGVGIFEAASDTSEVDDTEDIWAEKSRL
jgi:hypothetical protein